jgi:hypothetical protein
MFTPPPCKDIDWLNKWIHGSKGVGQETTSAIGKLREDWRVIYIVTGVFILTIQLGENGTQ